MERLFVGKSTGLPGLRLETWDYHGVFPDGRDCAVVERGYNSV